MSDLPDTAAHCRDRSTVEVPATSANLGAGFDALAIALDLVNTVTVRPAADLPPTEVFTDALGEGAAELSGGAANRFTEAFLGSVGDADHGWQVEMHNAIPLARGLGSSAAATVAGLVAGRALRRDRPISDDDLLAIATRLEGHPENAAAALVGGFVVAVSGDMGPIVRRIRPARRSAGHPVRARPAPVYGRDARGPSADRAVRRRGPQRRPHRARGGGVRQRRHGAAGDRHGRSIARALPGRGLSGAAVHRRGSPRGRSTGRLPFRALGRPSSRSPRMPDVRLPSARRCSSPPSAQTRPAGAWSSDPGSRERASSAADLRAAAPIGRSSPRSMTSAPDTCADGGCRARGAFRECRLDAAHRARVAGGGRPRDLRGGRRRADGGPRPRRTVVDAPPGAALLTSAGIRPAQLPLRHAWRLAAVASGAMIDAAEEVARLRAGTLWSKWPNDIVADGPHGRSAEGRRRARRDGRQ